METLLQILSLSILNHPWWALWAEAGSNYLILAQDLSIASNRNLGKIHPISKICCNNQQWLISATIIIIWPVVIWLTGLYQLKRQKVISIELARSGPRRTFHRRNNQNVARASLAVRSRKREEERSLSLLLFSLLLLRREIRAEESKRSRSPRLIGTRSSSNH